MADTDTQTRPPARQMDGQGGSDAQRRKDEEERRRDQEQTQDQRRATARPYVRVGMVLVAVLLIGGGFWYWFSTRDIVSTDDAYTDGRAIPIASHVNGYVASLDVTDNQFVKAGQPLIHIDPRDYEAALEQAQGQLDAARGQLAGSQRGLDVARVNFPARLAQARAQLQDAEANLFKAQTDLRRQQSLPRAATTGQQLDYAKAAVLSAQAQVAQAQAAVQQATPVQPSIQQTTAQVTQIAGTIGQAEGAVKLARLNLEWCVVRAPQDGWVTRRNVEKGAYVTQGAQIMSLVSPDLWITANFKENQLNRMRPGQRVRITVDAYPELKLTGHVDSVQLGSGAKFSAFPPENATGNFVKIVQRVPVKILVDGGRDPALPLPLGLSAVPTVELNSLGQEQK